ncbi:MAG: helix-turn-helix domain-containing protein [Caldilineales bacterium]|nr:helix-turn-helix domain-containing protein [Caldilineales bacterium]MDW8317279.1 helix-turn-helix transcriptional regulator [Anaerolineae bacterium]
MATDLWQIRRRKKLTIDELATRAGIHPSLIKAYELGQRSIAPRDLEKLARVLMVEPWEIKELSDPPPRGPSREAETPLRFTDDAETGSLDYDSDPIRREPPRYGREPRDTGPYRPSSDTGPSRYGNDLGPSRFGGDPEPPRYGSESRFSRYGGEPGPSRYGGEPGPSRYGGEPGSSRFGGEPGPSRYGGEPGPSRYGGEGGSYRYGSEPGGGYGRSGGPSRYGNDRYSRYDDDLPARSSRPAMRPPARPYEDDRRMDRMRMAKKPRPPRRQPVSPARQSQIDHLKGLIIKLDMSGDDLLRLAGKPLSMLTRKEAARLLTTCQNMLAEAKPPQPKGKRQRPYLPESVDEHELVYLTEVQLSRRPMKLTLFNGEVLEGQLLGFSPYALTIAQPDNQEVTVQKLAVAYYEVPGKPITVTSDGQQEEVEA